MWKHPLSPRLAMLLLATAATASSAQTPPGTAASSPSLYLQASQATHGNHAYTLGLALPWGTWRTALWGGELTGYWDGWASQWSASWPGGRRTITVIGLTPTLRLRPDGGRAAWFVEAGTGPSYADRPYATRRKAFSTRFNFASHIGVGLDWGARRQHELVLRLQHASNADIKSPNPGENFLQLRYAAHF
jgi:lipid A 3-O-deacylase